MHLHIRIHLCRFKNAKPLFISKKCIDKLCFRFCFDYFLCRAIVVNRHAVVICFAQFAAD